MVFVVDRALHGRHRSFGRYSPGSRSAGEPPHSVSGSDVDSWVLESVGSLIVTNRLHPGDTCGDLARQGLPARRHVRRQRDQLRPVQRGGRPGRAVPVRGRPPRSDQRDPGRADRGRRLRLALLPAQRAAGAALRLPGARPVGPDERPPVQPEQAAARPVRQGHRRRDRLGPVAVRLQLRRPGLAQRRRLGRAHDPRRGDQPVLRLGGRPVARDPLQRVDHLRGPRQGADPAAPRRPRGAPRDVRRPRPPGDHRPPDPARRHRDRADAGAPVRPGQHPAREGPAELLGLQHPRVPGPARVVRRQRRTTRARSASRSRSSRRW